MKKVFLPILLIMALSLPAFAADIKTRDVKNSYMRYCTMNGGLKEICECSYQEAQGSLTPDQLEGVVKSLSAGLPYDNRVLRKMNTAVQTCAKKVERGELKVQRAAPPSLPVMPPPPSVPMPDGGASVPPPPPPFPGTEPIAIPTSELKDSLSIDALESVKNPAKSTAAPKAKKKKAAPKKEEPTYFGQYDNQFFDATIRGDLTGLRAISQNMPNVDIRDANGNTPLITSIIYGREVPMNFLLEKGADVNAKNGKDQTALQLASFIYRPDMVETLLAQGAKPDEAYGPGFTALMLATMKQDEATVKALLKYKAKPNIKMKDGNTALHIASAGKNMNVIVWLVTYGADVDIRNEMGHTPLMLAAFNGNEQAVRLLLGYKADASLKDSSGRTAAQLANSAGYFQIAQFLAYR